MTPYATLGASLLPPPSLSGGSPVTGPVPSGSLVVHGILAGFFAAFEEWVVSGTAALLGKLGALLSASTPALGGSFGAEFAALARLGELLALPFLVLAAVQAIVRQDLSLLLRALFLRLPAAFLLTGMATELVTLALGATDQASAALVRAGPSPATVTARLVTLLVGSGPGGAVLSGFAGAVIALVATVIALLLWLELAVRAAAVSVATLFLPLALAGLVWSATAHWARRLGETLAALVLAKLVVVGVLVLAAGTATGQQGAAGIVEGLALLLLAAGSPFSLLRLIPMVESGAVGHLEGLGRRGGRLGLAAGGRVQEALDGVAAGGEEEPGSSGGVSAGGVPLEEGLLSLSHRVVRAEAARIEQERGGQEPSGAR